MNPFTRALAERVKADEAAPAALRARADAALRADEMARQRRRNKKAAASRGALGEALQLTKKRARDRELAESIARQVMHERTFAWNVESTRGPGAPHGLCDAGCGYVFRSADDGEADHWIPLGQGGESTRENGWRLCARPRGQCHQDKHADRPSREEWNARRRSYCERAGIPFVERRTRVRFEVP